MKLIKFWFISLFVAFCLASIGILVESTKLSGVAVITFIITIILGCETDSREEQEEWNKQHPVEIPEEFNIRNLLREEK